MIQLAYDISASAGNDGSSKAWTIAAGIAVVAVIVGLLLPKKK